MITLPNGLKSSFIAVAISSEKVMKRKENIKTKYGKSAEKVRQKYEKVSKKKVKSATK